ncbi:response regulator [Flammeovirga sp. MY04]|uniref:sugar transferase n=1 Tax=Flammeovirga sp. MY04 TaxID=1191459 RepID=UPI0008064228|nr:sugar transferase [Flammeovirga sp. MY04]ANQ52090.1 response regulator [Flammeovirga sp. MY04]
MTKRILLLDDDKFMQNFVSTLLSTSYEVNCYSTIADAYDQLEKNNYHLVITDLNLTNESGENFIKQIKKQPKFAHLPIITLSGEDSSDKKFEILELGVDDYVVKPFLPKELLLRVKNILRKYDKWISKDDTKIVDIPKKKLDIKKNFYLISKRSIDIIGSFVLLTLLSPLFLIVAIAIRLESKGPIFYISRRIGKNYNEIPFLKFRSMKVNADHLVKDLQEVNTYGDEEEVAPENIPQGELLHGDNGFKICENQHKYDNSTSTFFKLQNDPRVTKVGAIIRKTSIDELPQLINVLLGHMSLVGNRPLPIYEAEQLTKDYSVGRFAGAAGITGVWQVAKSKEPFMSEERRIKLDVQYAQNKSIFKDISLIYKTPLAMVQKEE